MTDERVAAGVAGDRDIPRVTVIMPVRDEIDFIDESLGAVLDQDYPPERLQVLVVDGRSADGTAERARQLLAGRGEVDGRVLDNAERGTPHALNRGLEAADGDVILRIDGHCRIPPGYLRRCVALLGETGADCAGGRLETVGETPKARAIALAQSSPFGVGNAAFRTGARKGRFVDTLAFGAYRRSVFERIGRFDPELLRNQDDDLNHRLLQAGGRIWMDPSLRATYYSRADFAGLRRQYFDYGKYKVRVMQKRGAPASWRQFVPSGFLVALLVTVVAAAVTGDAGWAALVAGPYVAANAGFSLYAAGTRVALLPLVSAAFATMHLAYGTGFLWGIWYWRR